MQNNIHNQVASFSEENARRTDEDQADSAILPLQSLRQIAFLTFLDGEPQVHTTKIVLNNRLPLQEANEDSLFKKTGEIVIVQDPDGALFIVPIPSSMR